MNVLGIETATELVGAAAGNGREGAAAWATGRRRHTECLTPTIIHVMDQAGIELGALDAIAVDTGPGLFTGLRVGVATAKGLAQGLGIGVVGVGSLTILARAALDLGFTGVVVPVVDARRGEVFTAQYRRGTGAFGLDEIEAPRVVPPEVLARELVAAGAVAGDGPGVADSDGVADSHGDGSFHVVGDGGAACAAALAAAGVSVAGALLASPPPETLVSLALEFLECGGVAPPPAAVMPQYVRAVDAKVNWQQRAPKRSRTQSGTPPAS